MKKILLTSTFCATIAFGGADVLQPENRTFAQSKFMPDISLVMDASYVNRNIADDKVAHLEVPGVAHGLLGSHTHNGKTHTPNNAKNGFNLNYAELVLSSSVDPFFTMDGVFHFSEDSVEIEELYFTTTALGHGARVKGGKFSSNFGYLNEQHHHAWDFADMPLVYEAFLGMHGINETGLQLQWVAPTDTYLMIGAEILQGENTQMFGKDKIGTYTTQADAPALFVGYIKTSFDIDDTTILGGLSYAQGSTRIDHSGDEAPHVVSGDSKLYGADLVIKHYFDSYSFLKFQSELLSREIDGTQYNLNPANTTVVLTSPAINKKQTGAYAQLVYALNKSWQMGLRYDTIFINDITSNGVTVDKGNNFDKYSAMVEYHTSEFARFRLQYNHNNSLYDEDGNRQDISTVILQANISIGAHGAHSF
ncbi:hypothetical protein SMGD1_1322 [Sulfurimonas gotlandica GD1]|uniref:Zinc-regulated TonB-dependent outer membrane receptor n=1 Tax=Sulfurimonas gotlandica (strain DSM 19862 / JCM 16533 / GD1) TaxID=929558 RepID=B6BH57_SULGG|nr:TonB-dependent receptor [Sulfurimonas gotlandica]EDZ63300.1 conserved hypothetical protein [Sulfurimonas gotlandica GD1]EHP29846.1 hypothetical protein SMGD1_1322 [Sulfurimonas gotlandica GD1]